MPERIFFRDSQAIVTSLAVTIGKRVFPLGDLLSARGIKRRWGLPVFQPRRYALLIRTRAEEMEVLRTRHGFVVLQMARAIEAALRASRDQNSGLPPEAPRLAANAAG